jgi:hypothetical protein
MVLYHVKACVKFVNVVLLFGDISVICKIFEEMVRKEKDVRHQLMQHIIGSRRNREYKFYAYQYFQNKKRQAESMSRFDPHETLVNAD